MAEVDLRADGLALGECRCACQGRVSYPRPTCAPETSRHLRRGQPEGGRPWPFWPVPEKLITAQNAGGSAAAKGQGRAPGERNEAATAGARYLTLTMWPSGCFCRQTFTTQAVCSRYVMTRLQDGAGASGPGLGDGRARRLPTPPPALGSQTPGRAAGRQ